MKVCNVERTLPKGNSKVTYQIRNLRWFMLKEECLNSMLFDITCTIGKGKTGGVLQIFTIGLASIVPPKQLLYG